MTPKYCPFNHTYAAWKPPLSSEEQNDLKELTDCPDCGGNTSIRIYSRYVMGIKVYRIVCRNEKTCRSCVYALSEKAAKRKWNRMCERHDRRTWKEK
jgi:hypothetical protein